MWNGHLARIFPTKEQARCLFHHNSPTFLPRRDKSDDNRKEFKPFIAQ